MNSQGRWSPGLRWQPWWVTCEVLQVLLSQQVFLLVMQRTEELPAGRIVQVIAVIPLWTETDSG